MATSTLRRRGHGPAPTSAAVEDAHIHEPEHEHAHGDAPAAAAAGGVKGWLPLAVTSGLTNAASLARAAASTTLTTVASAASTAASTVAARTARGGEPTCAGCSVAFGLRVWRYECPGCERTLCGTCMPSRNKHALARRSSEGVLQVMCVECFVRAVRFFSPSFHNFHFSLFILFALFVASLFFVSPSLHTRHRASRTPKSCFSNLLAFRFLCLPPRFLLYQSKRLSVFRSHLQQCAHACHGRCLAAWDPASLRAAASKLRVAPGSDHAATVRALCEWAAARDTMVASDR
eukprot:m.24633 g.24633  ORF g.24633 m.24633 type:complete len:290 (-) comp8729_c0_seq1:119-988(-)